MITNNIKELCKEHHTTFAAVERDLGFGNGLISSWKNSSPSIDKLKTVADYFGVTVDFLLRD